MTGIIGQRYRKCPRCGEQIALAHFTKWRWNPLARCTMPHAIGIKQKRSARYMRDHITFECPESDENRTMRDYGVLRPLYNWAKPRP